MKRSSTSLHNGNSKRSRSDRLTSSRQVSGGTPEDVTVSKSDGVSLSLKDSGQEDVSVARLDCGPEHALEPDEDTIVVTPVPGPARPRTQSTPLRKSRSPSKKSANRQRMKARQPSASPQGEHASSILSPVVYIAGNTSVDGDRKVMQTFQQLGGKTTKDIVAANMLCVGDAPLMKTGSLLLAICHGKDIVTEKWLLESAKQHKLLETTQYIPQDSRHEQEWGFSLREAIKRGRSGMSHILQGRIVCMTKRLQESLNDKLILELSKVATALGAEDVRKAAPSKNTISKLGQTLLVIGYGASDPDAAKVTEAGIPLYGRDVLTMAALRGRLDLADFEISAVVKSEPT